MGGGLGGCWRANRKGCTREAHWNVPRGDGERKEEEKKGKKKRTNKATIAEVSHRCTGGEGGLLCSDDSEVTSSIFNNMEIIRFSLIN